MRVAGIEQESVVDGEGYRYAVFLQGCPHHCEGCHNPSTWDFRGGTEMSVDDIITDMKRNPMLQGVTISGGEPFMQPMEVHRLVHMAITSGYDVWVYTGYTADELFKKHDIYIDSILLNINMLVDGKFVLAERDLSLEFRGSRNQSLLNKKELRRLYRLYE